MAALGEERLPWHKPWGTDIPSLGRHENAINGKAYHGVNALYLWLVSMDKGYADNRWCTFKQASENGWRIRKGEKAAPVEYWYVFDRKDNKAITFTEMTSITKADPERSADMLLRTKTCNVFNGMQMEGIPQLEKRQKISVENTEMTVFFQKYLTNAGIGLKERSYAAYVPHEDVLFMPPGEDFDTDIDYFITAMHECAHSTGHNSRLKRPLINDRLSAAYAQEELRAEIASTFILSDCGIELPKSISDNNKAYIQSWIKDLEEKPNILFSAIKDAEIISDYVTEKGELAAILKEREMMPKEADKPRMADRLADAQRKADEHNEGIGDDVSKARQEPQL